jgi:hypothetical protein
MPRFTWKWSYQNRAGYRFEDGEIEVHRELGWLEAHMREGFNGDAAAFDRNVISAIGGAQVRWDNRPYDEAGRWRHWTAELYDAFVAFLQQRHAVDAESLRRMREKHPDVKFDDCVLVLPRPIYWDDAAGRFETEPFYVEVLCKN